jgi:hypothetical protein
MFGIVYMHNKGGGHDSIGAQYGRTKKGAVKATIPWH